LSLAELGVPVPDKLLTELLDTVRDRLVSHTRVSATPSDTRHSPRPQPVPRAKRGGAPALDDSLGSA